MLGEKIRRSTTELSKCDRLAIHGDIRVIAISKWIGINDDLVLSARVFNSVGELRCAAEIEISEDENERLQEIGFAGPVLANKNGSQLGLIEIDTEVDQILE